MPLVPYNELPSDSGSSACNERAAECLGVL